MQNMNIELKNEKIYPSMTWTIFLATVYFNGNSVLEATTKFLLSRIRSHAAFSPHPIFVFRHFKTMNSPPGPSSQNLKVKSSFNR